jgi:hypothetical protein
MLVSLRIDRWSGAADHGPRDVGLGQAGRRHVDESSVSDPCITSITQWHGRVWAWAQPGGDAVMWSTPAPTRPHGWMLLDHQRGPGCEATMREEVHPSTLIARTTRPRQESGRTRRYTSRHVQAMPNLPSAMATFDCAPPIPTRGRRCFLGDDFRVCSRKPCSRRTSRLLTLTSPPSAVLGRLQRAPTKGRASPHSASLGVLRSRLTVSGTVRVTRKLTSIVTDM